MKILILAAVRCSLIFTAVTALKQANNLFASLKSHTRLPLNHRQHSRKNSAKIKIRVPIKKVPTQESDDASGKRPATAKVLVVHRIGSSALTGSA